MSGIRKSHSTENFYEVPPGTVAEAISMLLVTVYTADAAFILIASRATP
jgi:hypothetical protein